MPSFIDYFSLIEMLETTQPIKEGAEGVESVSFQMKNLHLLPPMLLLSNLRPH